jgi:hypothetical protein
MLQNIKVPAIAGAILTALAGVLAALAGIPVVGVYAVAAVSVVNVLIPALSGRPGHATFKVPALVGVILTALAAALVTLEGVSSVAIYATPAAGAIHALVPLFRYDKSLKGTTAAQRIDAKVEVPAFVGTLITVGLVVCSLLAEVPGWAPYVAGAMTFLHTVAGYFTYSD